MRRLLALATAAALAALAAGAAPASAGAAPLKYRIDALLSVVGHANLEQPGSPDHCRSWTSGESTSAYTVSSRDPVNLALVRSPIDDSVFGLMPRGPVAMSDSWRRWRTRSHIGDNTADCVPCGPLSEYGLCTGALPDQVDEDDCGGHGATRRGTLVITVTDRGLTVAGAPMPDLSACRDPRGGLIPVLTGDARMPPLTIPDGTRKLLRMRVGQQLKLKRSVVRGDCRRLRGPGLRTCSERVVIVKVTRFG